MLRYLNNFQGSSLTHLELFCPLLQRSLSQCVICQADKSLPLETLTAHYSVYSLFTITAPTDNGRPERAFFQKFESFGLGQTNWAEILGCILVISSQTIGTILAL